MASNARAMPPRLSPADEDDGRHEHAARMTGRPGAARPAGGIAVGHPHRSTPQHARSTLDAVSVANHRQQRVDDESDDRRAQRCRRRTGGMMNRRGRARHSRRCGDGGTGRFSAPARQHEQKWRPNARRQGGDGRARCSPVAEHLAPVRCELERVHEAVGSAPPSRGRRARAAFGAGKLGRSAARGPASSARRGCRQERLATVVRDEDDGLVHALEG